MENLDRLSRDETLDAAMMFLGILPKNITLITMTLDVGVEPWLLSIKVSSTCASPWRASVDSPNGFRQGRDGEQSH